MVNTSPMHATATKMEQALCEEQDCLFEGTEDEWAAQPTPDGPMMVGIDGGFVHARRKAGFFEVIAGKSIVPPELLMVSLTRTPDALCNIPCDKRVRFRTVDVTQ